MSKTKRTTATAAATSITEEQMRESFAAYVTAYCQIEKIEADTKARTEAIKLAAEVKAAPFQKERDKHEAVLFTWASQNPDRFVKPRKMEVYGGHKLGYDLGQPSVALIKPAIEGAKGKQTVEGLLAACKSGDGDLLFARNFIRTIEETDKQALLRWYSEQSEDGDEAKAQADALLARLGAKVTQVDRLVIDLNLQPNAVGARTE